MNVISKTSTVQIPNNQTQDVNENTYKVEAIVDKKKIGNNIKYLIKWVGISEDLNSWEPIENLYDYLPVIVEFEKEYNIKKALKKKKKCIEDDEDITNVTNDNNDNDDDLYNDLYNANTISTNTTNVKKSSKKETKEISKINYA